MATTRVYLGEKTRLSLVKLPLLKASKRKLAHVEENRPVRSMHIKSFTRKQIGKPDAPLTKIRLWGTMDIEKTVLWLILCLCLLRWTPAKALLLWREAA